MSEGYNPARKFAWNEDEDQYQTYEDEAGNKLTHDEFMEVVRRDAAEMEARGESAESPTVTMPPLPGEDD